MLNLDLSYVIEPFLSFHFFLKELSPFKTTILEAISCRWVELCEISKFLSIETHHNIFFSIEILGCHLAEHIRVALVWDVSPHHHVRVQIEQNLIVSIDSLTL